MRYYKLRFTDANGSAPTNIPMSIPISAAGGGYPYTFSSHSNLTSGIKLVANLGALDISFDVTLGFMHNLAGQTHFRIYNPTLDMVRYAPMYQGLYVTLDAGFLNGLPLANNLITKSGLIFTGYVQSCFANWMGTELALDFIATVSPTFGNPDKTIATNVGASKPINILFNWQDNQTLYTSIQAALACSGINLTGTIAGVSKLRANANYDNGFTSLQAFASYIYDLSLDNNKTTIDSSGHTIAYSGVMMEFNNSTNTVTVSDNSYVGMAINLNHEDFIGQPTFNTSQIVVINGTQVVPAEITSAHPLRNDLVLNANVVYPSNTNVGVTPNLPFDSDKYLVRGNTITQSIVEVRHVGRFRDMSAMGWATHIRCNYAGQQST